MIFNFTETLQSPATKAGETSEQASSSSTKTSQSNLKSSTSTTPTTYATSSSPMISPISADSVNDFSFINAGCCSSHEGYPLDAPFSHSALCSNGTEPNFYSPCGYNVREMSLTNQAPKPTTVTRESAPFQQSSDSTQYSPTISRSNRRKADNDSLLLLANCATLVTTDNRVQECPSSGITKVGNSSS